MSASLRNQFGIDASHWIAINRATSVSRGHRKEKTVTPRTTAGTFSRRNATEEDTQAFSLSWAIGRRLPRAQRGPRSTLSATIRPPKSLAHIMPSAGSPLTKGLHMTLPELNDPTAPPPTWRIRLDLLDQ